MSGGIGGALEAHLQTGSTTLCHAWRIDRTDGVSLAFTDHDLPLAFDGVNFRADAGLGARALSQCTGLSVDNTEAIGALTHESIREDEIEQGRYDNAEVLVWLVNWQDVSERWLQFRGTIGELHRSGGAFRAELRGLTETLNVPQGRIFQKPCTAVLGDGACRLNIGLKEFSRTLEVQSQEEGRRFVWEDFASYQEGWFTRGRLEVLSGAAEGLWGTIKHDRTQGKLRTIELWEPIRGEAGPGTSVRLVAGCDKRLETCRSKFANIRNFQGFPDLPGSDWMMAVPKSSDPNTGGSLR